MRILVCGGRDFSKIPSRDSRFYQDKVKEYQFVMNVLHGVVCNCSKNWNPDDNWLPTDITIISGAAKGVDTTAIDYSVVNYTQLLTFPADWETHGKRAGYLRNKRMLEEGKPDLVVAFPGGKGTAMMVDIAEKAGVTVFRIAYPPQEVEY